MQSLKIVALTAASLLCFYSLNFAEMTAMSLQERVKQSDAVVVGTIEEVHQTDVAIGGNITHWLAACRVERCIIGPKIHNPNVEEAKAVSLIRIAFEQRLQTPMLAKLVAGKKYLLFLKETGPNEYEMITPYHGAFEAGQDHYVYGEENPTDKLSFDEIVQRVTPQNLASQQPVQNMNTYLSANLSAVHIFTDKKIYNFKEKISVTVKNNFGDPVWFQSGCGIPFILLQKEKEGKWGICDPYPTKKCYSPPVKLEPEEKRLYSIQLQDVYTSSCNIGPGIYKFKLVYSEADLGLAGQKVHYLESYSDEFSIRR